MFAIIKFILFWMFKLKSLSLFRNSGSFTNLLANLWIYLVDKIFCRVLFQLFQLIKNLIKRVVSALTNYSNFENLVQIQSQDCLTSPTSNSNKRT